MCWFVELALLHTLVLAVPAGAEFARCCRTNARTPHFVSSVHSCTGCCSSLAGFGWCSPEACLSYPSARKHLARRSLRFRGCDLPKEVGHLEDCRVCMASWYQPNLAGCGRKLCGL